ncbi:uncharacterized protein LOC132311180 isoform X3 [Cornus florida]|uniref:uncharacterized protein LOC132311180 isoform X3 n=2 Tax=Cornus florida TaxID=4283 RepID=UPI00289B86BF|nr:uncharacterized protein LOC132311180 isoform X3 [Cornus florida]
MDCNSQSSGFQSPGVGSMGTQSSTPPFLMQPPRVGSMGTQTSFQHFHMQPPGVGTMGRQNFAPPFPMQPTRPLGVGTMGPQSSAPPFPMQPPGLSGVGTMGPQSFAPPFPMPPPRPPGVGTMDPQSSAPPFPMQVILAEQGHATLGSQLFCSFWHGRSLPNVGMPFSLDQPLLFSQPMQQLPPRLGQPNIRQTQQTGLGGPGAPFSSYSGSFSSSHTSASSSFGQQTNVTPVQVTGQQPSVTAATVPITQSIQVSLLEAADVIGVGGANVAYIHQTSGANLIVSETEGVPEQMTIEMEGTSSEVDNAERLIQEFIKNGTSSKHRKRLQGLHPGVGSMGTQSYAPTFPMQGVLSQQGHAPLASQQFYCSGSHGISSPNVGMPFSLGLGQPMLFSQPMQQLPTRHGLPLPNIPQTEQTFLGCTGTPFSSS